MTLVDLSPGMLKVSKKLNPEIEHIQGDMRTVRLDKEFDAVFIHDAIVYMSSREDLFKALKTAFIHCKPGGVALFATDHCKETYKPYTSHGGHDSGNKGLRYLEWSWDPDPSNSTYLVDFAYLFKEEDHSVQCVHDRHVCGLFTRDEWLQFITIVGFEASIVPFLHSEIEPGTCDVFVGVKTGL